MNIREFRTNLRQAFDMAQSGTPVSIERNGTVYTLSVGVHASTPVVYTPNIGENTIKRKSKTTVEARCTRHHVALSLCRDKH